MKESSISAFAMSSVSRSLPLCGPTLFLLLWIDTWKLFFVAFHVPSRWVLTFLTLFLHDQTMSLYFPKAPVSASTSDMLPFYMGYFFSEAHFSHMQTPGAFAWFHPHGDEPFLSLKEVILELYPHVLDSSPLQGHMPWVSSKQVPEHPKVFPPEAQDCDPAFCLVPSSGSWLCLLMATAFTLTFTSPNSPSMFVSVRSSSQPLIVDSLISFIRNLS